MTRLLALEPAGLYCAAGGFHIDPWQPVDRALITHAHADHARGGSAAYLGASEGAPVLRARLPADASIETLGFGERRRIGDVDVSFHPAGHVLGSAQIRIEGRGEVVVVSGDYKLAPDPTCAPFEPVKCTTFVTESTFGLPIYRWPPPEVVLADLRAWWTANAAEGLATVVFAYALGKAQRIAAGVAALGALPGPIACHGALARINDAYREAGVPLPPMQPVATAPVGTSWAGALVLAPPSAQGSTWMRRFEPCRTATASGWMAIRGTRRRANVDRGFVLSDHADWPALNAAVDASGAESIWVTHGYRDEFVRWIGETRPGRTAVGLATHFEGEQGAAQPVVSAPETVADNG
jgi:putative mRNA 3-end processing factor